MTFVYFLTAT